MAQEMQREYWPNGQLKQEEPLVDGKRDGLARYWHSNGQLYSEIPWRDGVKHGPHMLYREDGSLEQALNYDHGELDGILTWFHEDGSVREKWRYETGRAIERISGRRFRLHPDKSMDGSRVYKTKKMLISLTEAAFLALAISFLYRRIGVYNKKIAAETPLLPNSASQLTAEEKPLNRKLLGKVLGAILLINLTRSLDRSGTIEGIFDVTMVESVPVFVSFASVLLSLLSIFIVWSYLYRPRPDLHFRIGRETLENPHERWRFLSQIGFFFLAVNLVSTVLHVASATLLASSPQTTEASVQKFTRRHTSDSGSRDSYHAKLGSSSASNAAGELVISLTRQQYQELGENSRAVIVYRRGFLDSMWLENAEFMTQ